MFDTDPSLLNVINSEMLDRAGRRDAARNLWGIGKPYEATPTEVTELVFRNKAKRSAVFHRSARQGESR
jgi:hypothetical protein